jgi:hypothetical protein
LRAYREKAMAALNASRVKLVDQHRRKSNKLFSKADRRQAFAIASAVTAEWRAQSVRAGGDAAKVAALATAARRKFQRKLGQALPHYRAWQALARTQLREHRRLTDAAFAGLARDRLNLDWGDLPLLESDAREFVAPFSVRDVQTIQWGNFVTRDLSSVRPELGHLLTDIVYDQDADTSFSDGLWGTLPIRSADSWSACGVNFTVPTAGRLQIGAVLQNHYNHVAFSVTDNWGFSSAEVAVTLRLFVAVAQAGRIAYLPTTLLSTGLTSHGSAVSGTMPDLDTFTPYTVSGVTEETFAAGDSVQILAGSELLIGTALDDMHCKASGVLLWALKKLTVGVV